MNRVASSPLGRIAGFFSASRRTLARLREKWGEAGTRDGWLASRYFDLVPPEGPGSHIDDRTWKDLEFPRTFTTLDTTVTRVGSQFLFRALRTYPSRERGVPNGVAPQMNVKFEALRGCHDLVRAADRLAAIHTSREIPQLAELAGTSGLRARARREFGRLAVLQTSQVGSVTVWLNFLFLAELLIYLRSYRGFMRMRAELRRIYELVGSIDAATAVAGLIERAPWCCQHDRQDDVHQNGRHQHHSGADARRVPREARNRASRACHGEHPRRAFD